MLHDEEFVLDQRQSTLRLDDDHAEHAVGDVMQDRVGAAVVHLEVELDGFAGCGDDGVTVVELDVVFDRAVVDECSQYDPAVAVTTDGSNANSVAMNSTWSPGAMSASAPSLPPAPAPAPAAPDDPPASGPSGPHAAAVAMTKSAAILTLAMDRMCTVAS